MNALCHTVNTTTWIMRAASATRAWLCGSAAALAPAGLLAALLLTMPAAQAQSSQFQNGGFESKDFQGWTLKGYTRKTGGTNGLVDGVSAVNSAAVESALTLSGTTVGTVGTGQAADIYRSRVLTGASRFSQNIPNTNTNWVKYPFEGQATARVGGDGSLGATSMEQVATMSLADVDPVDNKVHVRFAMAPVLNNPNHDANEQPFFFVEVFNVTKNKQLFRTFNFSGQAGIPWQSYGAYQFTDWQAFDISPGNGQLDVGDQVRLVIYTANCRPSAADHSASVYVDVFGSKMPGLSVYATGPAVTKPGEQITYTYNYSNNSGAYAINSWVRLAAPFTENSLPLTFVPGSWPPGCTGIHAGSATPLRGDYIDCPVGDLNNGDGGKFSVTFTVPAGAATTSPNNVINNGDYDIRADTLSPFLGPLVKTIILPAATPTVDLGITVNNGGVSSYAVGGPVAYTVTVTNNGPVDVIGAIITQTLTGISGTAAWACAPAPGSTATCGAASGSGAIATTGNLPVGQGLVYTVTGITATAAGTPVVTVVNVTPPAGTSDSVSSNNTDGLSTPVSASQHRLTVNTDGAGTGRVNSVPATLACASPGGTACSSQLLGDGQEAYLTAVADPGSVFKNWSGDCTTITGNQCYVMMGAADRAVTATFAKVWTVTPSITGGTITPNTPLIVEDGQGTSVTITPGTPGQVPVITTPGGTNTCPGTLTGPDGSGNYTYSVSPVTQDCAFDVAFVTPAPALSIAKSGPASAIVGAPFDYTITVTNAGTATTSAAATVTDVVPAGLTINSAGSCSIASQTVTCTVPAGLSNVAPGNTASFTINVTATTSAAASVSNTASVSGGGDPACPVGTPCTSTPVVTTVVTPTITASNDVPAAVTFGSTVVTTVGSNDTATDGTVDAITSNTDGTNGTVACTGTGAAASCTYTPNVGFSGTDSYTYTICLAAPNASICDTATVSVVVGPDAVDDAVNTPRNTPVSDTVSGGDTYPTGSVFTSVGTATNGTVTVNPDGSYTFTPTTGFTGTATFDYQVCLPAPNGTVCDTATVTVTVGNVTIDAVNDAAPAVTHGSTVVTTVGGNDTATGGAVDAITGNTSGTFGTAVCSGAGATASCTYTPNLGFSGVDSYTYTICLAAPNADICDTATVSVVVGPDAVNDAASTPRNTPVTRNVSGNDSFQAGSTFTQVGPVTNGVVTMAADGAYTFTPTANFTGTATFDYRVCLPAPNGAVCDTATVTVTVGVVSIDAVNDNPPAVPFGSPVVTAVGGNDTAVDGTVGAIKSNTNGTNGTVACSGTGAAASCTYTPSPGFTGTDTYTYEICLTAPNADICSTATVSVVIGPDAVDDTANTTENTPVTDTVTGGDSYPPGSTFGPTGTPPTGGTVTVNPDGSYTFVPTPGFTSTGTFEYQVCLPAPNAAVCSTATVSINVTASADVSVVKTLVTGGPYAVGQTVTFRIVVSNAGPSVATNVVVTDVPTNLTIVSVSGACAALPCTLASIAAATGLTIDVTATIDAVGAFFNNATAGTPDQPDPNPGNNDSGDGSTATTASLSLNKVAGTPVDVNGNGLVDAGDTIDYSFTVTNTGGVPLSGVVVDDAKISAAPIACTPTTVPLGGTATCGPMTYVVTPADVAAGSVRNSATATATLPGGTPVTSSPSTTETPTSAPAPGLSAVKAMTGYDDRDGSGGLSVGDVMTYAITVSNTGNVSLNGVVVEDGRLTPASATCATVPAGGACVLTGTAAVTQADADVGQAVNTAVIVVGSVPGLPTLPPELCPMGSAAPGCAPTNITTVTQRPSIATAKTAVLTVDNGTPGVANVGDVITYAVTVANTGDVTLAGVTVEDTLDGHAPTMLACAPATLAPGQTATCATYTHVVTQEDASRPGGKLDNKVVATASSVSGGGASFSVTALGNAAVLVEADPVQLRVVKTAGPRDVKVGDLVRYTLSIQNTGKVALVNGSIVDTPPAGFSYVDGSLAVNDADKSGQLAGLRPIVIERIDVPVGQTASVTYLLRVGAGVRAGTHTNSVLMRDKGETVSNVATADVQLVADPTLDESLVVGTVFDDRNGNGLQESGERGIPGVRLASVEGLLVETDQFGRYHLTGIDGGRWERGRNFILKVDPATLPPGTVFSTDNPLLRRVTPGLPVRFDFGVTLPEGKIGGGTKAVELELGEVLFAPESASLREAYLPVIDAMAAQIRQHGAGEVVIAANGAGEVLALDRAKAVRDALLAKLDTALAQAVTVSLRTDLADPNSTLLSLGESPVLGTVLFDTDKAEVKPEFAPLIEKIAADIEKLGGGVVGVIGHADRRGSDAYNQALGLRRAKAVYEAIAARLGAEARSRLRVEINDNPTAPVGLQGR